MYLLLSSFFFSFIARIDFAVNYNFCYFLSSYTNPVFTVLFQQQ